MELRMCHTAGAEDSCWAVELVSTEEDEWFDFREM